MDKNYRGIAKYDIYNESFDAYFRDILATITPAQKENMPLDLLAKVFKGGDANSNLLSQNEKTYILSRVFGKQVAIVIQDEDKGFGINEFQGALKAQKAKMKNIDLLNKPVVNANFIFSDKQVFESLMYLNHAYCSDIYSLIKKINPAGISKTAKEKSTVKAAIKHLADLLMSYERHKKRIVMQYDLDVPKIYALLYFSGHAGKLGMDFYQKDFKHAYSANERSLKQAVMGLWRSGHLERRGGARYIRYSLSAKGIETLDKMLRKILELYNES